jgi:hypothetical protein
MSIKFSLVSGFRDCTQYFLGSLECHPQVLCHEEPFGPSAIRSSQKLHQLPRCWADNILKISLRNADPDSYLQWLTGERPECGKSSFSALGYGLYPEDLVLPLERVLADASTRIILLEPKNRVWAYVADSKMNPGSIYSVETSPSSPLESASVRLHFDPAAYRDLCRRADALYQAVRSLAAEKGNPLLELTFDSFSKDLSIFDRVFDFIDVPRLSWMKCPFGVPLSGNILNQFDNPEAVLDELSEDEKSRYLYVTHTQANQPPPNQENGILHGVYERKPRPVPAAIPSAPKRLSLIVTAHRSTFKFLPAATNIPADLLNDVELVFVNDDPECTGIRDFLKPLCLKHPSYVYVEQETNRGMFEAYRTGFLRASGQYSAIYDADDVLRLRPLVEELRRLPLLDLIYTNEYFVDETGLRASRTYSKPGFDFLSSLFYFYTHHLTLWRTDIVQPILRAREYANAYGMFDIWLMLHYMRAIDPRTFSYLRLDESIYGWRIHGNSTSSDALAKPWNLSERLNVISDFFQEINDPAIVTPHTSVPYAVHATFFSAHDMLGLPARFHNSKPLLDWLHGQDDRGQTDLVVRWIGPPRLPDLRLTAHVLCSIPWRHLSSFISEPLMVACPTDIKALSDDADVKRHVHGVPFMKLLPKALLAKRGLRGFYVYRRHLHERWSRSTNLLTILVKSFGVSHAPRSNRRALLGTDPRVQRRQVSGEDSILGAISRLSPTGIGIH